MFDARPTTDIPNLITRFHLKKTWLNILREMMEIIMNEMTGINMSEMIEIKKRGERLTWMRGQGLTCVR